jgi:hypothetical protein
MSDEIDFSITTMRGLLYEIEQAVAERGLTRVYYGVAAEARAEIVVTADEFTARCDFRHGQGKGHGARSMTRAIGHGATPREAADALIKQLDSWIVVLGGGS